MADPLTEALNSPSGRLAEVILTRVPKELVSGIPEDISRRLDKLVTARGEAGVSARVRLAADVSYLFDRIPEWTERKLIPVFDWSSRDASKAWDARKYSQYLGSPELFRLTKKPFLELFGRDDMAVDDLRTYAEWLVVILMANRGGGNPMYPLEATEARTALRRAGANVLSAVAHRLASEMHESSPDEGAELWRTIVGPVFKNIWPLDVEIQSNASNFAFVQILTATGPAFPDAAREIIPYIRPDDPRRDTTIFLLADAPEGFFKISPATVLDLIIAITGDLPAHNFIDIDRALSKICSAAPELAKSRKFQKLIA